MATIQGYYQGVPIYQGEDYVQRIRDIDATGATTTRTQAATNLAAGGLTGSTLKLAQDSLASGYAKLDSTQPPTTTQAFTSPYPQIDPVQWQQGTANEVTTISNTLQKQYDDQIKQYQDQVKKYQTQADAYTKQMESVLKSADPTQGINYDQEQRIIQNQLDAAEVASQTLTENFTKNQAAIAELEALWTQASNEINLMSSQTGLSSIRAPRIQKTIDDYNARKGILQAVMAARSGQIAEAQGMVDQAFQTSAMAKEEQLNYYNALLSFYGSQQARKDDLASEARGYAVSYVNAKIGIIEDDLKRAKDTRDYIKQLMIDPATAGALQGAGVTTNMTIEEINQRLGTYAQQQDARELANKLALEGFTPALQGQIGAVSVQNPDGSTSWYKPAAKSSGTGAGDLGFTSGFASYDVETDARSFVGGLIDDGITYATQLFNRARGEYSAIEATDDALRSVINQFLGVGTPAGQEESTGEAPLPGEVTDPQLGGGAWYNPWTWVYGISDAGGKFLKE